MNTRAIEQAFLHAAIIEIFVAIALLALGFWITYLVIKAGVRDGIKEASGSTRRPLDRRIAPSGYEWKLVKSENGHEDIRAD